MGSGAVTFSYFAENMLLLKAEMFTCNLLFNLGKTENFHKDPLIYFNSSQYKLLQT